MDMNVSRRSGATQQASRPASEPIEADDVDPASMDPSLAVEADDGLGDIVEELGNIRPAHKSRKSQVADFLMRRNESQLSEGNLRTAARAHTSRFFRKALEERSQGQGGGSRHDLTQALIDKVKPRKGSQQAVFARVKTFAAGEPGKAAALLAGNADSVQRELAEALVASGMGATRARNTAQVIYTALVAQVASDNEGDRLSQFNRRITRVETSGSTRAERLETLAAIERDLAQEGTLSTAGRAQLASRANALRALLEPSARELNLLVDAALKGVTTQTPALEVDARLRELDHAKAIAAAANLPVDARASLEERMVEARALLMALFTRTSDLQSLDAAPHLQQAMRSLDAKAYTVMHTALGTLVSRVGPDHKANLLDRLDELIHTADQTPWLAAMAEGDLDIIDLIVGGDEMAWKLKESALASADPLAMVNALAQHECRKAARELDQAMQAASMQASRMAKVVNSANPALPVNAFSALKADAALIGWLVRHAPRVVDSRDLAIASWIRLSLHDAATGKPDSARCDELFAQLRKDGIDIGGMEAYARQGFKSVAEVAECARQVQAFSTALQKNALTGSLDPRTRAADPAVPATRLGRATAKAKAALGLSTKSEEAPDATGAASTTTPAQRQFAARRKANEAMLQSSLAQLTAGQRITVSFGTSGEVSVSAPVVPGVSVSSDSSAQTQHSARITLAKDGSYAVEILRGASARQGTSVSAAMDILSIAFGVTHTREKGHELSFASREACEAFVVALATGADLAAPMQAARSVEKARVTSTRADGSVTATADFTVASLSLAAAVAAGESHSVHENSFGKREVFSREVSAEVLASAEVAGGLASAQAGAGMALGVRREVVREGGMLAGGEKAPTLSLVATVSHGNRNRCLDALLSGVDQPQRNAIAQQLGEVEDGTELYVQYRLKESARVQANGFLGHCARTLSQAAALPAGPSRDAMRVQAATWAKRADEVMRAQANYEVEGFGWNARSENGTSRSRGAYTLFAQRKVEQQGFVALRTADGGAPIGHRLLVAAFN